MVNIVGIEYLEANTETDEYSYPKAYKQRGLKFNPIMVGDRKYEKLDIRFVKKNLSILIETKKDFNKDSNAEGQLSAYVEYEKNLTENNIIAILANTQNDKIKVWKGEVTPDNLLENEKSLRNIEEYEDFFNSKINDKEKVMKNTYSLNEKLNKYGIPENLRSQFVGTCLLALKNNLKYEADGLTPSQIIGGISDILTKLVFDGDKDNDDNDDDKDKNDNKLIKLNLLNDNVLNDQDIKDLSAKDWKDILDSIKDDILPFINDKSTAGQDLLNLFFVTFNKYVGKKDKNQAFTPDHITDFMSKITRVDKNSVILDPCCGSGAFLVRAMTQAIDDCNTLDEKKDVKTKHIYGIEIEEKAFGLSTTNMLIHGDGNANIIKGNCFKLKNWIKKAKPDVILMNPPYNANKKHFDEDYARTWSKSTTDDPSNGFYFVRYIADVLNEINIKATIAVLLPVSCAIRTRGIIKDIKKHLLEENTLDAVFTLPEELFHPGSTAPVCCMVFKTGIKHFESRDTFFGYYKDDGFKKTKKIGRVEQYDIITGESKWKHIEEQWIDLYINRKSIKGISVTKKVTYNDEWLCEAHMETDYSNLSESDFRLKINDYLTFVLKEGKIYDD